MKKAICVGINNYPGASNDLQGCVNDAHDWSALLKDHGFETSLILDSQATRENIRAAEDACKREIRIGPAFEILPG